MQAYNVRLTNEEANLLRELDERPQNARKVKLTLPLATSDFLEGTPQPTSFLSPKKGEHLASENPLKTILIPHSVSKRENELVNKNNNNNNHTANNNNNNNNVEYDQNQIEFLSQQIRSLQAQVEALAREQRGQNQHSSLRKSIAKEANIIDSFPSSLKEIPPTLVPKPIPYMEGLVLSRADFLPSGWTDEQSMYSPPSLKLQELDHVKPKKKKRKSDKNPEKITKIENTSTKNSHSRPPIYQEHKKSTTNTTTTFSSSRSTSPLFQKPRAISAFSSPKRERILNEDSAKIVKAPDRSTSAQRQRERDIKSDKEETNLKSNDTHNRAKKTATQSKFPKTRPEKLSVIVPPSVSASLKSGSKKKTSNRDNSHTNKTIKGKQSSLVGGFTPLLTVKQSKP